MKRLKLQFVRESSLPATGYDRGHIRVFWDDHLIRTSEGHLPDQSMMLFPSLVLVIDQVVRFVSSSVREVHTAAAGSSFSLWLKKMRNGVILVDNQFEVSSAELVFALQRAVENFGSDRLNTLRDDDLMCEDWVAAVEGLFELNVTQ